MPKYLLLKLRTGSQNGRAQLPSMNSVNSASA